MSCNKANEIKKLINLQVGETVDYIDDIWNEIGIYEDEKETRFASFSELILDLLEKVRNGEKNMKKEMISEIDANLEEIKIIAKELKVAEPHINRKCTILELKDTTKEELNKIKEIRDNRLKILHQLKQKDECLCTLLCETPYYIPKGQVPDESELQAIRDHIGLMERYKEERQSTLSMYRREILRYLELLEQTPDDSFTREFIVSDEEELSLGNAFLQQIKNNYTELQFRKNELEINSLELREKVKELWDLLEVPKEQSEEFLSKIPQHSATSVKTLHEELEKLTFIKKQNVSKFVDRLSFNLKEILTKCYIGYAEIAEITKENEKPTELLMDYLDNQIVKWKKFYDQNLEFFTLLDQFNSVFERMLKLQEKAKDSKRLFNTRGGTLLQEEKERKRVKASLPKIEERLLDFASGSNEMELTVYGMSVVEYVQTMWDKCEESKPKKAQAKGQNIDPKKTLFSRKRGCDVEEDLVPKRPKHGTTFTAGVIQTSPVKHQKTTKMPATLPRSTRPLTENNYLHPSSYEQNDGSFVGNSLQTTITYDNFEVALRNSNEQLNSTSK